MKEDEKYFLLAGLVLAAVFAYLIAQHNKTRGYSFGKSFFYTTIILSGLVFMAWQYFWNR